MGAGQRDLKRLSSRTQRLCLDLKCLSSRTQGLCLDLKCLGSVVKPLAGFRKRPGCPVQQRRMEAMVRNPEGGGLSISRRPGGRINGPGSRDDSGFPFQKLQPQINANGRQLISKITGTFFASRRRSQGAGLSEPLLFRREVGRFGKASPIPHGASSGTARRRMAVQITNDDRFSC